MDSFPIKDGKFVAGKGEHNYKEVIDDFKNASFIGIVTFNLSQNESGTLISKLKETCNQAQNSFMKSYKEVHQIFEGRKF